MKLGIVALTIFGFFTLGYAIWAFNDMGKTIRQYSTYYSQCVIDSAHKFNNQERLNAYCESRAFLMKETNHQ